MLCTEMPGLLFCLIGQWRGSAFARGSGESWWLTKAIRWCDHQCAASLGNSLFTEGWWVFPNTFVGWLACVCQTAKGDTAGEQHCLPSGNFQPMKRLHALTFLPLLPLDHLFHVSYSLQYTLNPISPIFSYLYSSQRPSVLLKKVNQIYVCVF